MIEKKNEKKNRFLFAGRATITLPKKQLQEFIDQFLDSYEDDQLILVVFTAFYDRYYPNINNLRKRLRNG